MTQADLATETGIALRTVTNILANGKIKTTDHLTLIANALGVSEDWLTKGDAAINQSGNVNAINSKQIRTYGSDINPEVIRLETENKMLREQLEQMKGMIENLTEKLTQRNP